MTAAFPSERQKTAQRLARELLAFGGRVTNVLPLREGQNLRFWVSDYKKNELLQQMKDAGYEPVFVGMMLQACEETYTLGLVNKFELVLPADRQPAQDNRIYGEIATKKERHPEVEATLAYVWGKK